MLILYLFYWFRKAVIGSSNDALHAGYKPETIPTKEATVKARIILQGVIIVISGVSAIS